MEPTRTTSPGLGVILGTILGFGLACGLGGVGSYFYAQRAFHRARAGWNLVPVIVANQDIPAGTAISFDMISQRPVPEQFVTSSVIKPDQASYTIGAKLTVSVQAGDVLLWSQLAGSQSREECERACAWVGEAEAKKDKLPGRPKAPEPMPFAHQQE